MAADGLMASALVDDSADGFVLSTPGEFCTGPCRRGRSIGSWCDAVLEDEDEEDEGRDNVDTCEEETGRTLLNSEDADLEELLNLLPRALADRYAVRLRLSQLRRHDAEQRAVALEASLREAGTELDPAVAAAIMPVPASAAPLPATSTAGRRCWRWAYAPAVLLAMGAVIMAVTAGTFGREKEEALSEPPPSAEEQLAEAATVTSSLREAAATVSMQLAALPQQPPAEVRASCAEVLVRTQREAADMEALVRRTIQGYQQMVVAITDWVSGIRDSWAARSLQGSQDQPSESIKFPAGLPSCLARVQAAYEKETRRVNAALLASHDQRASQRARCRARRMAIVDPASVSQHAMQS
mmetsp:Transcript_11240/g.21215  ORF Transcript_11240/g.21215 Transcript_11240/m.21215 type:complete len:355 (-) Transcript_11240:28-1092(-)